MESNLVSDDGLFGRCLTNSRDEVVCWDVVRGLLGCARSCKRKIADRFRSWLRFCEGSIFVSRWRVLCRDDVEGREGKARSSGGGNARGRGAIGVDVAASDDDRS